MSEEAWGDSGSLTPPLVYPEGQWQDSQEFDLDDDVIDIDTVFISKRQKRDEFDENEFTPFFNCCLVNSNNSEEKQKLTDGYLETGFLVRLLQNEDVLGTLFQKSIIKLFGYEFVTASALVEQTQTLFYLLRQKIFEFESQQNNQRLSNHFSLSEDDCWFYKNIRKHCCSFLLYISAFVHRNLSFFATFSGSNNETCLGSWSCFAVTLKNDINNLWLFIGPVSRLSYASFVKNDKSLSSPSAQWLHLHLEMKWGIIETLWRLYSEQEKKSVDQLTEIEEKASALLRDLIHISTHVNRAGFKGSTQNALMHTTPFLCACVKELWVIMIHFLDFLSTNHGTKSFWSALTMTLNELLQGDKEQASFSFDVSEVSCKDPVSLCWWLLAHVSPLYWYNVKGEYTLKEKANVSGNWILVQDLLRLSFVSKDARIVEEDLTRGYLTCCLQISQHWHPSSDVVLILWDYFHKKMNEMFYLPKQQIQIGFCTKDTAAYDWFQMVVSRCDDPVRCNGNETSYDLFLRIVCLYLKKLKDTNPLQGWKQLKGRFYSKFNKKRMNELSEQGLFSFFNLFLTLAYVEDLEDVSNKILSFLELLDFNLLEFGKMTCIWKGYFVLLFLFKSKKTNAGIVAQKVCGYFTDICRDYKEQWRDKIHKQKLWSLISVYLDNGQALMEYNDVLLGENKLIGEGFGILLSIGVDGELGILVTFIESMLAILSNEVERQDESKSLSDLAHSLWEHIFPHIQQRIVDPSISQAYSSQFTNLAVGFTLLSISTPPKDSTQKTLETFHNLARHFGVRDSMIASVACQFLAILLASPDALELIKSSDYQASIIHTWFRCSLQVSSPDQHLLNLTRIVLLKLPETANIIKTQRTVVAGNVEAALSAFIRNLGERFSSLILLEETVAFREKALFLIGDFYNYIESFLKQAAPPDRLRLSYKVAALLVKYCPKIIYRKTQHDCLLPKIIDKLVLPLNKKLPPGITECIKLNLTEFLEGLATLDFERDEFVKRKIKIIFSEYFHIFNKKCYLSSNSPVKNPFFDVLKPSLSRNPTQDSSDFRQHVISIIKENFLFVPGCALKDLRTPQDLTPTLFFLLDLFKRTLSPGETARNTPLILEKILACLLDCDIRSSTGNEPAHIRNEATKVLELMMISCQKAQDVILRDSLFAQLKDFLTLNISQFEGAIFKVFGTISKFDKELVLSLLPVSKEAILTTERKRGVGTDNRLRTSFKSLLESLEQQIDTGF